MHPNCRVLDERAGRHMRSRPGCVCALSGGVHSGGIRFCLPFWSSLSLDEGHFSADSGDRGGITNPPIKGRPLDPAVTAHLFLMLCVARLLPSGPSSAFQTRLIDTQSHLNEVQCFAQMLSFWGFHCEDPIKRYQFRQLCFQNAS